MNMANMQVLLGFLVFALLATPSWATFCVCKSGLKQDAYQKAIDYACGAGADCNPIKTGGPCYNPSSPQLICSYAANSYFQKNAAKGATCDFQGTATPTNSDPSSGSCSFSATSGSGSTSTGTGTPVTTVPTTSPTTPTSTPVSGGTGKTPVSGTGTGTGTPTYGTGIPTPGTGTGTTSPYTAGNPTSTGVLGGGVGLAPTGSSMDDNHGSRLDGLSLVSILALVILGIMWM